MSVSKPVSEVTGQPLHTRACFSTGAIQRRREGIRLNMTTQGRGKRNRASEFGARPIQSHSDDTSGNHSPSCEEIRLRAYEIYLERGSLPGNELDDWLQAEREIHGRAQQRGALPDIEGHKP